MATQVRIRRRGRIRMLVIAATIGGSSLLLPAVPAMAQSEPYSTNQPDVLPTRIERDEAASGTEPAADRPSDGLLPVTGAELTLFVVTGLAAIKTGMTLMKRGQE